MVVGERLCHNKDLLSLKRRIFRLQPCYHVLKVAQVRPVHSAVSAYEHETSRRTTARESKNKGRVPMPMEGGGGFDMNDDGGVERTCTSRSPRRCTPPRT